MNMKSSKTQYLMLSLIIFLIIVPNVLADDGNIVENLGETPQQAGLGHPKMESRLHQKIGELIREGRPQEGIRAILEVEDLTKQGIESLISGGAEIEFIQGNLVQALVKPNELLRLVDLDFVEFIRTPLEPLALKSEGVGVMGADQLHSLGTRGHRPC